MLKSRGLSDMKLIHRIYLYPHIEVVIQKTHNICHIILITKDTWSSHKTETQWEWYGSIIQYSVFNWKMQCWKLLLDLFISSLPIGMPTYYSCTVIIVSVQENKNEWTIPMAPFKDDQILLRWTGKFQKEADYGHLQHGTARLSLARSHNVHVKQMWCSQFQTIDMILDWLVDKPITDTSTLKSSLKQWKRI